MLRPSKKLVLALEAVADIAYHGGAEPVQSQDIGRRLNLPRRYLEQVMQQCEQLGPTDLDSLGMGSDSSYGLSKACANSYTQILAREYPRLSINACTPGFIETDLGRDFLGDRSPTEAGMKTPAEGARVILRLLFGESPGSGHYFGSDSLRSPMDRYRAPGSPAYTGE